MKYLRVYDTQSEACADESLTYPTICWCKEGRVSIMSNKILPTGRRVKIKIKGSKPTMDEVFILGDVSNGVLGVDIL